MFLQASNNVRYILSVKDFDARRLPFGANKAVRCSRNCSGYKLYRTKGNVRALSITDSAASTQLSRLLEADFPTKGQLLEATLTDGSTLWLEVASARGGRLQLLCFGELLELYVTGSKAEVRHKGFLPRLSEPWVKRCPLLVESLKKIRQDQQTVAQEMTGVLGTAAMPSQRLAHLGVMKVDLLTTAEHFAEEVLAAPRLWVDGTGPSDPPLTPQQTALLTAGELVAFLQGRRGVSILQLYKGWDDRSAAQQPLLRPFVLRFLQQATEDKGVAMLPSLAPQGLGMSLLLAAKQQPFRARAELLAKVGVQSALVADSPYYKILVGTILGYKEENILHHVQVTGGEVDRRVMDAVQEELRSLSQSEPTLPWNSARKTR